MVYLQQFTVHSFDRATLVEIAVNRIRNSAHLSAPPPFSTRVSLRAIY